MFPPIFFGWPKQSETPEMLKPLERELALESQKYRNLAAMGIDKATMAVAWELHRQITRYLPGVHVVEIIDRLQIVLVEEKPLTPLTEDPKEWELTSPAGSDIQRNNRFDMLLRTKRAGGIWHYYAARARGGPVEMPYLPLPEKAQLKKDCQKLQKANKTVNERLERADERVCASGRHNGELVCKNGQLENENRELLAENQRLRCLLGRQTKQIEAAETVPDHEMELRERLERANERIRQLEGADNATTVRRLRSDKYHLTARCNQLAAQVESLEKRREALHNELHEKLDSLEGEKQGWCGRYQRLEQDHQQLKERLRDAQVENQRLEEAYRVQLERAAGYADRNRELVEENAQLAEDKAQLKDRLERYLPEPEKRLLQEENQRLEEENRVLVEDNQELRQGADKARLSAANTRLVQLVNQLRTENHDLRQRGDSVWDKKHKKLRPLAKENRQLRKWLEIRDTLNHELQDKIERLTGEGMQVPHLLAENHELGERNEGLEAQHGELLQKNQRLEEENRQLNERNNQLENSVFLLQNALGHGRMMARPARQSSAEPTDLDTGEPPPWAQAAVGAGHLRMARATHNSKTRYCLEQLLREIVERSEKGQVLEPWIRQRVWEELSWLEAKRHPDDLWVESWATTMKRKMRDARRKGRSGWNDPEQCSVELLGDMLADHLHKDNADNYVDIAILSMMLHTRGAARRRP